MLFGPATIALFTVLTIPAYAANSFIPTDILDTVAPCAQPCVNSYISTEFIPFVCTSPPTLACLCSQYSHAGPSLGAIISDCNFDACLNRTIPQDQPIFDYCQGDIPSTITATFVSTSSPSTSSGTVTPAAVAQAFTSTTGMSLPSSITNPGDSGTPLSSLFTASLTTSSTPSFTSISASTASPLSSSSTSLTQPSLNSGQIAGISVAAVAAAIILSILLGSLVCCCRRRRQHQQQQAGNAPADRRTSRFGASDKEILIRDVESGHGADGLQVNDLAAAYPKIADPAQIGLAVSSGSHYQDPHTIAQTLHSKPVSNPFATPQSLSSNLQKFPTPLLRPESSATYIEDQGQSKLAIDTIQDPARPSTNRQTISPLSPEPIELPCDPVKASQARSLNIKIPARAASKRPDNPAPTHNANRDSTASVRTIIQEEPQTSLPLLGPMTLPPTDTQQRASPGRAVDEYIPSYYMEDMEDQTQQDTTRVPTPSPAKVRQTGHSTAPTTPLRKGPHPPSSFISPATRPQVSGEARPAGSPRRPPQGPTRQGSRDSRSSETSFETAVSGESDLEGDHNPRSTSSRQPSRVGARFPVAPQSGTRPPARSSPSASPQNRQRQHRSPQQKHDQAGNTIAEKRKGSDAASDLQKSLWITASNGRTGQPQWPARSTSKRQPPNPPVASRADDALKSPLWEPKLTPKRLGKDLIIEVS